MIVARSDDVLITLCPANDLQAGRLLVLADIQGAVTGNAADLTVDGSQVRDITRADWLVDDIERGIGEFRQVVHRSFHRPDL